MSHLCKGIRNTSIYCYLNSILQALASMNSFLIFMEKVVQCIKNKESFSYYLYDCLISLRQYSILKRNTANVVWNAKEPYDPTALITYIYQHSSNNQHEQQVYFVASTHWMFACIRC